jgi:hypothetical protein
MSVAQSQACNRPHQVTTTARRCAGRCLPEENMRQKREGFEHRPLPRWPSPLHCRALWVCAYTPGTCGSSRRVRRQRCSSRRPTTPPTPSASRGACGRGLDPGARRHTARQAVIVLNERDERALGLCVPLDRALRHGQAGMARELLHVPETAPDLGDSARCTRNEGTASRVRRTPVHLQRGIESMEPQAHGGGL